MNANNSIQNKPDNNSPSNTNSKISLEEIYDWIPKAVLISSEARSKKPMENGRPKPWKHITYEITQQDYYQRQLRECLLVGNICVRFGDRSGGLAAIDLDSDECAKEFLEHNPRLEESLIREGKKGLQVFLYPEGDYPNALACYKAKWGEWRVGGNGKCAQSVLLGEHPEGFYYKVNHKPALRVPWEEINWPDTWDLPWKKSSSSGGSSSDDEYWRGVNQDYGRLDLTTLRYKDLVKAMGITYRLNNDRPEYPDMVRFRCPLEKKHTNPSAPTDVAIWQKKGERPVCLCFHETCGIKTLVNFLNYCEARAPGITAKFCQLARIPIELPHTGRLAKKFTTQLGEILRPHDFFNYNTIVSTLKFNFDLKVQELRAMGEQAFRTAIEDFCTPFIRGKQKDEKGTLEKMYFPKTISHDQSKLALNSPQFINQLRLLERLNYTRLPIVRQDGPIELLPHGYDEKSHILTLDSKGKITYEINWSKQQGTDYLKALVSEFCFLSEDREHAISVTLAGMLTLFCRHLFTADSIRPNFLWTANQEGAGKTLGAKVAIVPTLGYCPSNSIPQDETEMRKNIVAAVMNASSVLFFDNVKRSLNSDSLEALTTSPIFRDRILGGNREIKCYHGLTVYVTGNGCTFSPDFRRRTLVVELFLEHVKPEERRIKHPLDDAKLIQIRPEILAAMWALVKAWDKAGRPGPRPDNTHGNFIAWSQVIGGILGNAGFTNLYVSKSEASRGGDQDLIDMEKLLQIMKQRVSYRFDQLEKLIKENELFQRIYRSDVSAVSSKVSMGRLFKRFENRILNNRRFVVEQWGKTREAKGFYVQQIG